MYVSHFWKNATDFFNANLLLPEPGNTRLVYRYMPCTKSLIMQLTFLSHHHYVNATWSWAMSQHWYMQWIGACGTHSSPYQHSKHITPRVASKLTQNLVKLWYAASGITSTIAQRTWFILRPSENWKLYSKYTNNTTVIIKWNHTYAWCNIRFNTYWNDI